MYNYSYFKASSCIFRLFATIFGGPCWHNNRMCCYELVPCSLPMNNQGYAACAIKKNLLLVMITRLHQLVRRGSSFRNTWMREVLAHCVWRTERRREGDCNQKDFVLGRQKPWCFIITHQRQRLYLFPHLLFMSFKKLHRSAGVCRRT